MPAVAHLLAGRYPSLFWIISAQEHAQVHIPSELRRKREGLCDHSRGAVTGRPEWWVVLTREVMELQGGSRWAERVHVRDLCLMQPLRDLGWWLLCHL